MAKHMIDGIEIETSSGNVFANLGLPDADKLKIKSGLVIDTDSQSKRQLCCFALPCTSTVCGFAPCSHFDCESV